MRLDVFHPITREQKNAIQDQMIIHNVQPEDLVIDTNQPEKPTNQLLGAEDRIRRMFDLIEVF